MFTFKGDIFVVKVQVVQLQFIIHFILGQYKSHMMISDQSVCWKLYVYGNGVCLLLAQD